MNNTRKYSYAGAPLERVIRDAQEEADDDTPAMREIVVRFEPLAKKVAASMTSCPQLREDLVNASRYATVRAVRKHDLTKPGFPSFAERYIRGAAIRAAGTLRPSNELDIALEAVAELPSSSDEIQALETQLAPFGGGALSIAVERLKPEQQRLVRWRYVDGRSMRDIANSVGTSVPAVSQRFATVHHNLQERLVA